MQNNAEIISALEALDDRDLLNDALDALKKSDECIKRLSYELRLLQKSDVRRIPVLLDKLAISERRIQTLELMLDTFARENA